MDRKMKNMRRGEGYFRNMKKSRKPERGLYKSKKPPSLGKIYKIRFANDKRTTGHGTYKTFATLQVIENSGGGECLFISILHHLQHEKYADRPRTATDIRKAVTESVIQNWFEYAQFSHNFDRKFQNKFYEKGCTEYYNIEKCQKMYRRYMNKLTSFGTHVELEAASKLYGFQVVLLRLVNDETELTISTMNNLDMQKREFRPTCYLLFTGNEMAGHFRFLKPIGHTVPGPNGTYEVKKDGDVFTATLVSEKLNTKTRARYEIG